MAYSENDLTSMRRNSETLFTEFVATQFLGWRGSDDSTSIVAKQADGCVAAQRIVHALHETGGDGIIIHQWSVVHGALGATLEWVDWFNNVRLLEPSGYVPPAKSEQTYYALSAVKGHDLLQVA